MPTKRNHNKVLIVEDELPIRNVLAMGLRRNGYEVVEAEDALSAVDLIKKNGIGVILLDLLMPRTDGVDVLAYMVGMPEPKPHVIVMSNLSEDEAVGRIGSYKVDRIMTKASLSLQQIMEAVAQVIGAKKK